MRRGWVVVAGVVAAASAAVSGAAPASAAPAVHPGMILPRGGVISTFAGSAAGFSGDAALADRAMVGPVGVATPILSQADGSFLITTPNRIRKVSPTGVISTVAGNGTFGFSGDGGPATSAEFGSAEGITALPNGAFLFADALNHRIRKVSQDGIITTVAGTGTRGFSGDGGPATAAQLNDPTGVAATFDNGGFLIVDKGNERIRRVSFNGTITTVAGNGGAGFSGDGVPATQTQLDGPSAVAPYPNGSFLIADANNGRIRRVSTDGIISTAAGGGILHGGNNVPATSVDLELPEGVATEGAGFLIADTNDSMVRRVSAAGIITTVAGIGLSGGLGDHGPATSAQLNTPTAVAAIPGGGVLIADFGNSRVRQVDTAGIITTAAGRGFSLGDGGEGSIATQAQLQSPAAVTALPDGSYLIADLGNGRIRHVRADGSRIVTDAGGGPNSFAFGDNQYSFNANLGNPSSITLLPGGGYLIADAAHNNVRKVYAPSADGTSEQITTVAGAFAFPPRDDGAPVATEVNGPRGAGVLPDGTILIVDTGNNRIRRITGGGGVITTVAGTGTAGSGGDSGPATSAQLNAPAAIAVRPDGSYLIADTGNNRIRLVNPDGVISTVAGTGTLGATGDGREAIAATLNHPAGVTALPDGGFLIADTGNNRIRQVTPDRTILTAVGTTAGLSGDGGPAASAQLNAPLSVTALPDGSLLIADTGNNRIRRVTPNP